MLNHEVPHKTSAEVLNGNSQIASYFAAVDNAVDIGDTNKRYQPINNTSYGPPPPIHGSTFTTLIISPTADNTADIYNGYINAEMELTVKLNNATIPKWSDADKYTFSATEGGESNATDVNINRSLSNPHMVWIGFKDAMDAIEKYEIMANGISIYTQNNAIEESFITGCSLPEAAKRANTFSRARHKDIFEHKWGCGCGQYVDFSSSSEQTISIPLKIDLRRFLPLSNVKYLPAFAGKIELRVLFGTQGLVVAPVNPLSCFIDKFAISQFVIPDITCEFTPIGEKFKMITKYENPTYSGMTKDSRNRAYPITKYGVLTQGTVYVNAVMKQINKCESVINCFGIASDVYDELVMHYSQTPLTFPTQTITVIPFSNLANKESGNTSVTITPRFIDSIFLLFPYKQSYKTCYKNPMLSGFQLQCGGYGSIPSVMHPTFNNPHAIEELQNALNVNSDLVCLNKDVMKSMVDTDTYSSQDMNADGLYSNDATNFLIGLPTETDNTFQQGQTSNTPITYTLNYSQDTNNYYKHAEISPMMALLVDSTFSIQIRPDGAPPICELGSYDITSPIVVQQ